MRLLRHLGALAVFGALAFLFCCPGALHLFTHYVGPGGDQADTVWNMWHFRHALVDLRATPLWTDMMYWPYGFNLILAQYTLFSDLQAYFMIPRLGLVATYNLLLISYLALNGYALFALAEDFGASWIAAVVAAAAFAFSPIVHYVVYSGDGFCYQVYFPAVFFLWAFARAVRGGSSGYALVAALCLMLEWMFSYYYFLFCCLLIPFFFLVLVRPAELAFVRRARVPAIAKRVLEAALLAAGAWVAWSLHGGQREFHGAGSARSLAVYVAPYLVFWALAGLRVALSRSVSVRPRVERVTLAAVAPYAWTLGYWFVFNLPLLLSVFWFMRTGDYGAPASPWRGGGNPTDPLWLFLPDPSNWLWGAAARRVYDAAGLGLQTVNAVGLTATLGALWYWRRGPRDRWTELWAACAVFSFAITLGPWLKLWGAHLYLPLPFYFLHLLPVFSNIQHGFRFNSFLLLFLALLFARAIDLAMSRVAPRRRWLVPAAAAALVALECWPADRTMYQLEPPAVVARLAARPDGAVLTLPTGAIFNGIAGAGSMGNWWVDIGWQTVHGKPLVGGYLGRVPVRTYEAMKKDPYYQAILTAQNGGPASADITDRARIGRYLRQSRIRYVLVKDALMTPSLSAALKRWPVARLDAEGGYALYSVL